MREKVWYESAASHICWWSGSAARETAEHALETMDAINNRITVMSIFKMEGCCLLTGGQTWRDRSEGTEANKDQEITTEGTQREASIMGKDIFVHFVTFRRLSFKFSFADHTLFHSLLLILSHFLNQLLMA